LNYKKVDLFDDLPIGIEIMNVEHYSVHRHEGILEIAFVLKGSLDMNVSFDHIILKEGDFAFVNHHDFHSMDGKDDENIVLFIYVDLKYFSRHFKNIEYITFISEDGTNDRKNTKEAFVLRNLMIGIMNELNFQHKDYKFRISQLVFRLMTTLVNEFNEIVFYNQKIKQNSVKIDRYYLIMRYILENSKGKDILEEISNNEYFCKSYLYHLFKDVVTFSFQDIVCLIRNNKSEELLLSTNMSISEISAECGYSDPKYYYKHFRKWYHCTPAEFRQKYQEEIRKENKLADVKTDAVIAIANSFLNPSIEDNKPDLRMAKGIGRGFQGCGDHVECGFVRLDHASLLAGANGEENACDWERFKKQLDLINEKGLKPCIGIDYKTRPGEEWKKIFNHCISDYGKKQVSDWEFWIYDDEPAMIEEIRSFADDMKMALPVIEIKIIVKL